MQSTEIGRPNWETADNSHISCIRVVGGLPHQRKRLGLTGGVVKNEPIDKTVEGIALGHLYVQTRRIAGTGHAAVLR